ncbi:MAG TPA: 30S ribosomal protein S12 methylthiotransferase RimO [Gemmatimonadaceae bacterium]|nr:30S ribosomal protein S12 methylthiotransferase RimO [Gemmatimonadaceae bacterium]
MKVGIITLGCDKNTVDSERYLAQLAGYGAEPTRDLDAADVILVNTCGFIDAAKKESIDAILEAARLKDAGSCQAVVAVGCMVQRHKEELAEALPEVDLFLGSAEMDRLIPELSERGLVPDAPALHPGERIFVGDLPHVRYLKVSEGCDHGCAFCAIPLMRGRHRSFALRDIVAEAQLLEAQGAREVNLVAQDLAHYGRDRRGEARLPELLEALVAETGIPWIRMLYLYSAGITPRLLEVVAREPRIVRYLDMPIQHASDAVLERMRRPERQRTIREKVARYREAVPELAIRTTCIVGFPGETEDDFQRLLDFLEEIQFDRVGAFTYSPQEGTRAVSYEDDVPDDVKRERLERLMELQRAITAERYERHLGRAVTAIVDRGADAPGGPAEARVPWQAEDIDGVTQLDLSALGAAAVGPGAFVEAELREVVDDYGYEAVARRVLDAPAAVSGPRRRLPLIATSVGSFGR